MYGFDSAAWYLKRGDIMKYDFNDFISNMNGYKQKRRKIFIFRGGEVSDEIKQIERQKQLLLLEEQIKDKNFEKVNMDQQRHDSEGSFILKIE